MKQKILFSPVSVCDSCGTFLFLSDVSDTCTTPTTNEKILRQPGHEQISYGTCCYLISFYRNVPFHLFAALLLFPWRHERAEEPHLLFSRLTTSAPGEYSQWLGG